MTDETSIYRLGRQTASIGEIKDVKSLCLDCVKERLSNGWSILGKESTAFPIPCQDCQLKRRAGG